jgi:TPR repeat protein
MNRKFLPLLALLGLLAATAEGQSIGRIKRSLDRATGGNPYAPQTAPNRSGAGGVSAPAPGVIPAAPLSPAAAAAEKKKREQEAAEADKRVVDFLKQRIADGSPSAPFDLAKRHEEGRGVPEDPVEARRLMELAASRDNSEAKQWLRDTPAPKVEPQEEVPKASPKATATPSVTGKK